MAWNLNPSDRGMCADYYVDLQKCRAYMAAKYPWGRMSILKRSDYCWKISDNYENCKKVTIRKNIKQVNDHAVFPEDH
jgi:hypothetical protein